MLALTPDLVARADRIVVDAGPTPGAAYLDDHDYAAWTDRVLAGRDRAIGFWVFAYGSLIWKPEFTAVEQCLATAPGWHRSFCLRLTRWRGTRETPGLMLALDRGGSCKGIAFRIAEHGLREAVDKLLRREMSVRNPTNVPRWIQVAGPNGPFRALAFVANPQGPAYAGRRPVEEVAEVLATAAGHIGSGARYLHDTVVHLEAWGIRDTLLWSLQARVAEILSRRDGISQTEGA